MSKSTITLLSTLITITLSLSACGDSGVSAEEHAANCEAGCQMIAEANCTADAEKITCVTACVTTEDCKSERQSLTACIASQASASDFVCNDFGFADTSLCALERADTMSCVNN